MIGFAADCAAKHVTIVTDLMEHIACFPLLHKKFCARGIVGRTTVLIYNMNPDDFRLEQR